MLGVEALIHTPGKEARKGCSTLTHSVAQGHQASIPASLRSLQSFPEAWQLPLGFPWLDLDDVHSRTVISKG